MRHILFLSLALPLVSCSTESPQTIEPPADVLEASPVLTPEPSDAARAHAELRPMQNSGVEGRVDFTRLQGGVRVVALVSGLNDGLFGFTIHEGASCDQPGEHFNPTDAQHGDPAAWIRHAGDLGNIRSARGRARYDRIDPSLEMDSTNSIIGRVVTVHADQDDLNSQPAGGSGDIVACGIIEAR